jgi:hypothetical protein
MSKKYGPEDLNEARKAARNGQRIMRSAKSGREAVMNPRPLDYAEALELINAVDYLAWCVLWMAGGLERSRTDANG